MRWVAPWLLACVVLAGSAQAQPSSQDKALAETLFREAKKLAKAEAYDAACPKFEESQRLDPQLGTLLYLATCHEQQGKTASAWAEYVAAAELAEQRNDKRAKVAQKRAEALEGGLSRLTIRRTDGSEPSAITVRLDGKELGGAMLGTAMPVDPGEHEITATASGHQAWKRSVDVGADGDRMSIEIGDLAPEARPEPDEPPPTEPSTSALPIVGWVTFGVGAVSLVTGLGLGAAAAVERDAADEECEGRFCTDAGLAMHETSRDLATASTVTVIVGLVGMAAGVTLVLLAPSKDEAKQDAWLGLSPVSAGAMLLGGGTF